MEMMELAENIGLDVEDFSEIFEIYLETTSSYLGELKTALQEGDMQAVHEKAHSIKGASGNLGLNELYELAIDIDDQVRGDSTDGLESLVEKFTKKYEELVEDFQRSI